MAGGTRLERFADDLQNAGAHREATSLLVLKTGFTREESIVPAK